MILHKIGLTRRRDPKERVREQAVANGEDYVLVIALPTRSPAYLEKLVHRYLAKQRVVMRKEDGKLV